MSNTTDKILDDDFLIKENMGQVFAGFWIRVGASLLDALILLPLIGLSVYNALMLKSLIIAVIVAILMALYKPLMEGYYAATLGKMALKIKLVDYNFEDIDLKTSFIRYLPWLVTNVIALITMFETFNHPGFEDITSFIDFGVLQSASKYNLITQITNFFLVITALVIVTNSKKQGLHDYLAKTYCIKKQV